MFADLRRQHPLNRCRYDVQFVFSDRTVAGDSVDDFVKKGHAAKSTPRSTSSHARSRAISSRVTTPSSDSSVSNATNSMPAGVERWDFVSVTRRAGFESAALRLTGELAALCGSLPEAAGSSTPPIENGPN